MHSSKKSREMKEESNILLKKGIFALIVAGLLGYGIKIYSNNEKVKDTQYSLFQNLEVDTSKLESMLDYLKKHELNKTLESNLVTVTMLSEPKVGGPRRNLVELIIHKNSDYAEYMDLVHFDGLLDTSNRHIVEVFEQQYYRSKRNKLSAKDALRLDDPHQREGIKGPLRDFFAPGDPHPVEIIEAEDTNIIEDGDSIEVSEKVQKRTRITIDSLKKELHIRKQKKANNEKRP